MAVTTPETNPFLDAALELAKRGIPSFPTNDKRPSWSNKELDVSKGEGGYKVASTDPDRLKELFSHPRATELSVPMGATSGLMAIDVDLHKYPELKQWVADNDAYFADTLCHETRSGGLHFFFEHPGDNIRFPATLREGVDVKAVGNGFVCYPPTENYKALNKLKPKPFPMTLLKEAMLAKGGTGSVTTGSAYNEATDEELVEAIKQGTDFYPALRTLSYRMPTRHMEDGSGIPIGEQVYILEGIMRVSVASDPAHKRHDDWQDRFGKIRDLVESANAKHSRPVMSAEVAEMLADEESFIDTGKMIAATRPIGPQRETNASDIEARVEKMKAATTKEKASKAESKSVDASLLESGFTRVSAEILNKKRLSPIKWVIPGMIPAGGTVSLGGTSNVGKTRWLAALAALGSASELPLMGLPEAPAFAVLWVANEERVDDINRRLKAVMRQHDIKTSKNISLRGKDNGMMRLIAINETGVPEIDEANIARIVLEARRIGAKLIFFDPYVTLSDALDENSATSAAMLTKAFLLISTLTGAAVLHAHHTPKDRSKENDWYRGDAGAWRGSGAIYSALDCGYTLSHWMPKGKAQRKAWKDHYIPDNLSRWIVLDTGKIREGEALPSIVYKLVGQEMDEGEGDPIGVCALSSEHVANNVLLNAGVKVIAAPGLAKEMLDRLGAGKHTALKIIHDFMKGVHGWPEGKRLQGRDLEGLCSGIFSEQVVMADEDYGVIFERKASKGTAAKWTIVIEKMEQEVE
ncbi:MAG: AAA family ATPase [Rhodospirillaceae bacterium]|jgi:hypothetical protein|nr:AAA family ATPase [Rhodospirillaceae bacterium]